MRYKLSLGHSLKHGSSRLQTLLEIRDQATFYHPLPDSPFPGLFKQPPVPIAILPVSLIDNQVVVIIQFAERQFTGQQLVHHHAKGKDIGCRQNCRVSPQAVYLLRGHISISTEYLLGPP